LIAHSIKTDNACAASKINLRKMATAGIENLKVLDLFAGKNKLWSSFDCKTYYGVEKEKGKGKNLYADNLKVIPSLDLSRFNVIDVDSYGIPANQIEALYNNPTLKAGTVIIYTCITSKLSALNKTITKMFNIDKIYSKCPVLFNSLAVELFYGMLSEYGVEKVTEFQVKTSFDKHYGYFTI
jgi:hypothetical protein